MRKSRRKRLLLPIRRTTSTSHTSLLTVDGLFLRLSRTGRTIYFVSRRGGFFNVWGIHFDPAAGKTVGQPFQVSNFESPRLMVPRWIGPVGLSLTEDKLVLTMAEESGGIWVMDNVDR
jgi:hypothetical protein